MNLNKLLLLVMVAFVIGTLARVHADCADRAPGEEIEACASKARCTDQKGFYSCVVSFMPKHYVHEDFPSKCDPQKGFNCNLPLAECYYKVQCQWNGSCVEVANSGWDHVSEKKRTAVPCKSPDPSPE